MPLDPSIIAGLKSPQIQSPMEALTSIAQLQSIREQTEARRLAGEEARTKHLRQQQIDQAMQGAVKLDPATNRITLDKAALVAHLPAGIAYSVQKELDGDETTANALQTAKLNYAALQQKHLGSAAQTVVASQGDPHLWQLELRGARGLGAITDEQYQQLSTVTDPHEILALAQSFVQRAGLKPESGFTLGEGQVRYGPRGEVIATGPAKAPGGDTEAQANERYRGILSKQQLKQPVTPEEAAWAKSYEQQKTLVTDVSGSAAMDRQTRTIGAQVAQQQRSQDFTQLQAARQDIKTNVDVPYATARSGAETLRDVVTAAQSGNKLAGSLQSLEATMAAIRAQGLNRINMPEIASTAQAGTLWDHISSYVGQKLEGQPVPANIQKDMLAFADILDKAAYKKYSESHDAANTLYGTKIPRSYSPPASAAAPPPPGAAAAPKEGTEGVVNGVPAIWKTVNGKAGWYKK